MQNAALYTATGCTQDTNIQHLHDETLILHIPTLHNSNRKHNIDHTPYTNTQYTSPLQGSKPPLSLTTPATQQTFQHTPTHSLQRIYNKTCAIYTYLLSLCTLPQEAITKYCAHLHQTLAALKRHFPVTHVAPLLNSDQINHPFSNHTYTSFLQLHPHTHQL